MADPIEIELLDPPRRAAVNEPVPLRLVIRCPEGGSPIELRNVASRDRVMAHVETDLFELGLTLSPGEVYHCTAVARFHAPGRVERRLFVVRAGSDINTRTIDIPTPTIQVVPSLLREIRVTAESVCTYDHGTKVELVLKHVGNTRFDDFRLTLGPPGAVRAGLSECRRRVLGVGDELRLTAVVAGENLELTFDADLRGAPVGPVPVRVPVPPVRDDAAVPPFRFLEARKLTRAAVVVRKTDDTGAMVAGVNGVHTVFGGGTKYRVEVTPDNPQATAVRLRGVSGTVEVADLPADAGTWAFQMVVIGNNVLTAPVALHYDVATPDGPQQGELNLAVRPTGTRLWVVAATAGAALTLKGAAAGASALLSPGEVWASLGEAATRMDTVWDLVQFGSIFLIRAGLSVVDWFAQLVREA